MDKEQWQALKTEIDKEAALVGSGYSSGLDDTSYRYMSLNLLSSIYSKLCDLEVAIQNQPQNR